MPVPVVLNEVSCAHWPEDERVSAECLRQLAQALVALNALPRKTFMLSHVRLGEVMFGNGTLARYMGDASVRDALRQILSFGNRAPFESFSELDADGAECFLGPHSSLGALYAHLLGTLVLSFPTDPLWSEAEIQVRLTELDAANGEIIERRLSLGNIASRRHVALGAQVISCHRQNASSCGTEVWANREDWFPSLSFLPRVESDLSILLDPLVTDQVTTRLFELQDAASRWDPTLSREPAWSSRVTGEAETRKRLCSFVGLDGAEHTYDLHARYTPGAGRIHFRLLPADGLVEIAYIGAKLGA